MLDTFICIAVVLIAIYSGIKMYALNVAEGKVNELISMTAEFVDIDYEKVSVDLLGLNVRASNVIISYAAAKKKIIIYDIDDKTAMPKVKWLRFLRQVFRQ